MNIFSDEVTMSSVQNLRELINERLTAAAEEIFTEFEKTIVQYEEEIDRQRRLLDNIWKPQIKQHTADLPQPQICKEEDNIWQAPITLHTTELPQQYICKEEEVFTEQNVCNQERKSSVDQEDPESSQIKEEQEELCNSLNGQQLVPNQRADSFMLVECKSNSEELEGENVMVSENTIGQDKKEINRQRRLFSVTQKLQINLHRIDLQQQHICKEREVFTDHLLQKEERNFCLDQKDPEHPQITGAQEKLCISLDQDNPKPPQIKEEQKKLCISVDQDDRRPAQMKEEEEELGISLDPENLEPPQIKEEQELCNSQEGEQLDAFMEISTYEESDHNEPEPISGQLLDHDSLLAESPDQEGSKHPNSSSTSNLVMKTRDRNSSHSSDVDSSSKSRIHCDADTRKKNRTCDVCEKVFKDKSSLKRHYIIHTGEKPFFCETCGKGFTQRHNLTSHMKTHTGEKLYLCKVCGKRFYDLAAIRMHRAIHKDRNLKFCKICEKHFTQHSSLKEHMRVHRGEMPFSCDICDKNFTRHSRLKEHMIVHTGERPFSCEVCGQNFIKNSHLNDHMRIHTGEKPYSCNTCEKSFRYKRTLFTHMRVHIDEKLYVCNTREKI